MASARRSAGAASKKAVIFDFGNVLSILDRSATDRAFAAHCGLSPEEVGSRLRSDDLLFDLETGRIDAREHFERVKRALGADNSWNYDEYDEEFMRCILPNPPGRAALKAAAEAGHRTFILSNTSFLHSRAIFLDETLAGLPELYALSYKIGCMKPDPRIWLWLLERAGLEPEDCVYVDDVEAYCATAGALGMGTVTYDFRVDDLWRKLEVIL